MRGPLPIIGTGLFALLAMACGGDAPAPDAFTVVDSAGVEIVTSATPVWGSDEAWTLSEEPTLSIGETAGREAYTLFRVRAALRLTDGRIAIANNGTSQIRIYDSEGRHVRDLGRPGDGPGEFTLLMDLWRGHADSIVAADNNLSRLTVFDAEGALGRTISLQQSEAPRRLFGRATFSTGDLLVSGVAPSSERPRVGLFSGGVRQFDRYSAEGRPLNRIGSLPQGRNWGYETRNGPGYTMAPFEVYPPPHASDGETVFLGDGRVAAVELWSSAGELIRVIRWRTEPRAVNPELEDRYRSERIGGAGEEFRAMVLASLEGLAFPDHLPVYETLKTDTQGFLWVKPYSPEWEPSGPWWVFDDSGRWLGEVDIPPGLTVLDIGSDYLLGVVRDERDVERVVMYGLDRGSGS